MITASELRPGMALRVEGQVYRVLEAESRAGTAKMGGTIRARLENVRTGRLWDQHFRPLERLEDLELEKRPLQFLYSDGKTCTFLRLDTYEQVELPADRLGLAGQLLRAGTELAAEFFADELIYVAVPEAVEARVITTTPASRSQQDSAWKEATLENGITIRVPLFVGPGEMVHIDAKSGHYMERVRVVHKRGA